MGVFFMERKTKFSISFKETVVREYLTDNSDDNDDSPRLSIANTMQTTDAGKGTSKTSESGTLRGTAGEL